MCLPSPGKRSSAAGSSGLQHQQILPSIRDVSDAIDVDDEEGFREPRNRRLDEGSPHSVTRDHGCSGMPAPDSTVSPDNSDPWVSAFSRRSNGDDTAAKPRDFDDEPKDPPGTIGEPNSERPALSERVTHAWARYPPRLTSYTFQDARDTTRNEFRLFRNAIGEEDYCIRVQRAWMQTHARRYRIPITIDCDRVFMRESEDACYLEGMTDYLVGRCARPPVTSPKYWRYDLPAPFCGRDHEIVSEARAEWALSVGFYRVISFEDYNTLRKESTDVKNVYDVCTVPSRNKLTRFEVSVPWSRLPEKFVRATGVMGLPIRLPRVLYYYGTRFGIREYEDIEEKLGTSLEYEFLLGLVNALQYDWRLGLAWQISESCLAFLRDHENAPDIHVSDGASIAISDVVSRQQRVAGLPAEYFLERLDYPSQVFVKWANHNGHGAFVKVADYGGPRYGGNPLIRTGRDSERGYRGGFESGSRREPRRAAARGSAHLWGTLATMLKDEEIRLCSAGRRLLGDTAERAGGWSIRELLTEASEIVRVEEERYSWYRDETRRLQKELDDSRDTDGGYRSLARTDGISRRERDFAGPSYPMHPMMNPYMYPGMLVMPYVSRESGPVYSQGYPSRYEGSRGRDNMYSDRDRSPERDNRRDDDPYRDEPEEPYSKRRRLEDPYDDRRQ